MGLSRVRNLMLRLQHKSGVNPLLRQPVKLILATVEVWADGKSAVHVFGQPHRLTYQLINVSTKSW
jgi:hypothetical protein